MKRIVRLTESDLVRLVNRVIKEQANPVSQTNKYPEDDPIQKPFYEYVSDRWGVGVTGVEIDFDQNGNQKVCDGPCKSIIPGTDQNTIIWDYKKGVVLGLKSFGVDPKPISIKTNFQQMKQWFDNTYGRSS